MADVNLLKLVCKYICFLSDFLKIQCYRISVLNFTIFKNSLDASLDGVEILVIFAIHYQGVFTEVVEIIPIPVYVKKAGKDICVMNQFVSKYYFLTFKTITDF